MYCWCMWCACLIRVVLFAPVALNNFRVRILLIILAKRGIPLPTIHFFKGVYWNVYRYIQYVWCVRWFWYGIWQWHVTFIPLGSNQLKYTQNRCLMVMTWAAAIAHRLTNCQQNTHLAYNVNLIKTIACHFCFSFQSSNSFLLSFGF